MQEAADFHYVLTVLLCVPPLAEQLSLCCLCILVLYINAVLEPLRVTWLNCTKLTVWCRYHGCEISVTGSVQNHRGGMFKLWLCLLRNRLVAADQESLQEGYNHLVQAYNQLYVSGSHLTRSLSGLLHFPHQQGVTDRMLSHIHCKVDSSRPYAISHSL